MPFEDGLCEVVKIAFATLALIAKPVFTAVVMAVPTVTVRSTMRTFDPFGPPQLVYFLVAKAIINDFMDANQHSIFISKLITNLKPKLSLVLYHALKNSSLLSMSTTTRPKILITGATGQVGSKTIDFMLLNKDIELVAAVRSPEKAISFTAQGIKTVILDFDDERTHLPAFSGIDRVLIVTGYTVDMLRQSKALLDNAKKAGVQHVVHLGACGRDDTTVAHWAWHQLIERYIEWSGFSYTHLRPETFMQNVLSYGGKKAIEDGIIHAYVEGARLSWVDVEDVAQVAALALAHPDVHGGQTYRLGYDAITFDEMAALMTSIVGKPFRYEPLSPELFLRAMVDAGAEMAYMGCVYDHWKRYAAGTIPGADDTFNNFPDIVGKQPTKWADFIEKHKAEFDY